MRYSSLILIAIVLLAISISVMFGPSPIKQNKFQTNQSIEINFCDSVKMKTDTLLSQNTPDKNISASNHRRNLQLWKELFLKHNHISDDYFNNQIRLERVTIDLYEQNHFSVNSFYIVDWANIYIHDRFKTDQTEDEIKQMFETANPPTSDGLNYITQIRINSDVVEEIISCEKAVQILKTKDISLVPQNIGFQRGTIVLFSVAEGFGYNNKCPYAEISLINGSVIYYDQNRSCSVD